MASEPPQPPSEDKALYAHFPLVKDALTDDYDVVTSKSTIAALYRYDDHNVDNRLIRNLTGICDFKVPCQISLPVAADVHTSARLPIAEDEVVCALPQVTSGEEPSTTPPVVIAAGTSNFPPTLVEGKHGYNLYFTFNLLAIAPSVRIEAHFVDRKAPSAPPYLKIALEFPFNDRAGRQLHDFDYHVADDNTGCSYIRFTSTGASSEGATLISSVQAHLGHDERELLKLLKSLAPVSEKKQIQVFLQPISALEEADFKKLMSRLPGGEGHLLPSIGAAEFSNYPVFTQELLRQPKALMTLENPNLMVPLDCPKTFGSVNHFISDHLGCAIMSQWESDTVLQLFAMCSNKIVLYDLKGIPVIAMKYGEFPPNALVMGGGMSLPNELEIKITFVVPGLQIQEYTAVRDPYLCGLPPHDAYFVITSHKLKHFKDKCLAPSTEQLSYIPVVEMSAHPSSFLLSSLTMAMSALKEPGNGRFHSLALGQTFELSPVDVTYKFEAVDAATKEEAWRWLINYKPWNREQCRVIEQLKCAQGGITIATGTAGTGKTTVQMAMAVYFVKMGGRAACFATSNSNVATQAEAICELAKATSGSAIRVVHILSTSRGVGFKHLSESQAPAKLVGHSRGTVSTIYGLKFLLHDQRMGNVGAYDHTLELCMLEEAVKGELYFPFQYMAGNKRAGPVLNAWEEFRRHLEASLDDAFWMDSGKVKNYVRAFEMCRGHLVALADIVITTNGNAQCAELVDHWAKAEEFYLEHGVKKIKGLGVFIDEVGKEQEISVWNSILSKGLPRTPDFVMLLGDPKQLSPVNTAVRRELQCNPFADRGDMSMLDRLIPLGIPYIHLDVQQRMHPALWDFPSSEFYGAQSRSAPETDRLLEDVEPGLKLVLDTIIAKSFWQDRNRAPYIAKASDVQTRLHYLDFGIHNIAVTESHSKAVPKHIEAVFQLIFPALQDHFGKRTNREVMIIAAYGNAVGRYHQCVHDMQESQGHPDAFYPRILTVDASQGQEANMVIVDLSMLYRDQMGFMTDPGRSNVAMTRAKEVLWIIGGPLNVSSRYRGPSMWSDDALSSFPRYKQVMQARGQVHCFSI